MSAATVCDVCGKHAAIGFGRLGWFSVTRHTYATDNSDVCSVRCLDAYAQKHVDREAAQ